MIQQAFRGKRCLITGGLGFIGSNLAFRLVDLGAEVVIVDSLVPEYGGNMANVHGLADHVRINIADVRDQHSLQYLVQGQDYLFNLAGQVSHIDSMENPFNDLDINCRAQLSILEACRHNNPAIKIVFASTRQIYGRPDYVPVDEQHLLHPTDVNGINKMAGEWYHILYNNVYGIRACALRMTNTYGPRMLVRHARQTALGWFVRQALDNEVISIYGDGEQQRDYTYVDDAVEAFLLAAINPAADGQVFNLGGPEPISHLQLISTLTEVAGTGSYRLVPFPPEKARIDIGSVYSDYSRIQAVLGWQPTTSLRQGLEYTVNFYREFRESYW
ncbi:NAD-dependent epimerase/dehydratase family protein [Herpetosiphon geysericola]|uniref:NAD-dependent epimerase n=1 Tax=Herpetosiphon geysericola TaxID=70996 RepID=A0A0P6Y702_9CHLR|nr:NAD-dependent epimerase/dehydratase family protein [Herpetosiphon geysericola]KPL81217.1 NAD-dependent epimerase [Herpetosiphon geysericola]